MKCFLITVLTAVVVSVDSFVVGFSVSLNNTNKRLPLIVALCTFVLCVASNFVAELCYTVISAQQINVLGSLLLIILGIANLTKEEEFFVLQQSFGEQLAIGFTVGLDACIANLSVAQYGTTLFAPILFALFHYLFVLLGQKCSRLVDTNKSNALCAVTLWGLAVYKLL